jgi:hypothetical protein
VADKERSVEVSDNRNREASLLGGRTFFIRFSFFDLEKPELRRYPVG